MTFLKRPNYGDRKQISVWQGLGVKGEVDYKWAWRNFFTDGIVLYLVCDVMCILHLWHLVLVYIFQNLQNYILQRFNFTICLLYLNHL